MSLEIWDVLLVLVVTAMVICIAYLADPKWKAFMLTLPIPFSVAALSIGKQVDATNVLGLILLLIFTHGVRILHINLGLNIILSIIISAITYCALGAVCVANMPSGDWIFWTASAAVVLIAVLVLLFSPHRKEKSHRSTLPVWAKVPLVVCVVISLLLIKSYLRGFMTVFPMVGVLAAYEARHSLWTMSRQIPFVMLSLLPMMVTMKLSYSFGAGWSLACGWAVFLLVLWPVTKYMLGKNSSLQ